MDYLTISNWDKWQSYRKDRGQPPWIKVHRSLLRNPEWVSLSDAQRGQLVSIWMLAADKGGRIPRDANVVQKLCYLDEMPDFKLFISKGFIDDDVTVTSTRCQPDVNMTPQSREEKSREETHSANGDAFARGDEITWPPPEEPGNSASPKANGSDFERFWDVFPKKRNKKRAMLAFMRQGFTVKDVDELVADVNERLQRDKRWMDGFAPNPTTYIEDHLWQDSFDR